MSVSWPHGLLLGLLLSWPFRAAAESKPAGPPPPEVELARAVQKAIPLMQELPGRLLAVRTAEVRARVEGIVEKRLFQEGAEIKAGETLYRLDDRALKATTQAAEAQVEKAKAEAVLARQTLGRYQSLLASQSVSRQELDQFDAQHKKAVAEESAARAALTRARLDLDYATVTAPIAGRVGRSLVSEGALVGKGQATHLTTIEQMDPIRVTFTRASGEVLRLRRDIREGRVSETQAPKVVLLLDGELPYPHAGQLLFTEMAVDPQTGGVVLQAEFPNPDIELLPGQFVKVQMETGQANGVTVPQRAVQTTPQGQVVYMLDKENKVITKPVKTGGFSGKDWLILDGVAEGERVMVSGMQKVRPGMVVTPKE